MSKRIKKVFEKKNKKLVTFTTAGDPDLDTSFEIINTIINNGADIIEIGMPFSDPMADGPTIQESSVRSIKNGTKITDVFEIVKRVRSFNNEIPVILMGYYNSIYNLGINNFTKKCTETGVDGLIIVDLQPEEDSELLIKLKKENIDLIRLITPTTDNNRLKTILSNSSGFLYYVTITGTTGQKSANLEELEKSINKIRSASNLPIVAGFGIKSKKDVEDISAYTDGVVVGSSIVNIIKNNIQNKDKMMNEINLFTQDLKKGVK
ncbi:MAG: tryptophan synthase subunit alpha [Pelagibacteraceae bacterium]|jgi:tryptophan synthase alpha chain|nr:tryptophan synthase subunit alpha [Pelagibacteraceae bacterium]MBT6198146.1 tryptophan synthase subunit alpha [Pelagibacteraceae bacterium]